MTAPTMQRDQVQLSRLLGETVLAMAFYREGDQHAFENQVANFRALIEKLEKSPPKSDLGGVIALGVSP
jgi:hypothetical protein